MRRVMQVGVRFFSQEARAHLVESRGIPAGAQGYVLRIPPGPYKDQALRFLDKELRARQEERFKLNASGATVILKTSSALRVASIVCGVNHWLEKTIEADSNARACSNK